MKKSNWLVPVLLGALLLMAGCSDELTTTSSAPSMSLSAGADARVDVLIGFSSQRPEAAIKAAGGNIKHEYRNVPIVFASIPPVALDRLKNNPNILFIEEDFEKQFSAQTLDWGVDRVDAEYVHANSSHDGSGINVGVLDSGGDTDHPDITWAGGYSATNRDPSNWNDKVGHGTHVAGIISANNNTQGVVGIAPNCNIYAVQVGGRRLLVSDIVEGIDWIIGTHSDGDPTNDIQVVNMSFGGGASSAEQTALQNAYDQGILLVAASGNDGGSVNYPAAYSFVMAISASTSGDAMAGYSNYGSEIELIAPGSSILSTYKGGGYATMSGTSMASPMVVGAAALAWSAHPSYSRDQIRNLLKNSAEDIGLAASRQGSGLLDAEKAALGSTNGDDLGGGGDPGDPGGADTMHVASISFSNNKKNLMTYVTIHDEAHASPVSGASVTMTLHHVGGNDYSFGGTTNSSGQIKFTLRGISSGLCFEATVTGVTKSGTTYNSASNHETVDSYCIP